MKKILVIEDNDEVRENTEEILQLSNYDVIVARNGKEGVELALSEIPDLIICDIMMPVMDGYGVLHILNMHTETAGTPFIFLTAKSEKLDIRKGMDLGADDYLTKPFDGLELLNAVQTRLTKAERVKEKYLNHEAIDSFISKAKATGNVSLTSDEREICMYKKKHSLYTEGQRPKLVYYVLSGKVKTFKTNNEGKELITNIYVPGDFLGYNAIVEETNYKDSAQTLEECKLMIIPKEDFLELVTNDMDIAHQFIHIITRNIMEKEESLVNFAYNSLRRKVAFGLIQLMDKYKEESGAPTNTLVLSRKNMAHAIGVATESLIRTLGDFKDENLVDLENGKVIILNEKKLTDLPF